MHFWREPLAELAQGFLLRQLRNLGVIVGHVSLACCRIAVPRKKKKLNLQNSQLSHNTATTDVHIGTQGLIMPSVKLVLQQAGQKHRQQPCNIAGPGCQELFNRLSWQISC